MKKLVLALLLFLFANATFAEAKTDEELLKETVELSKEVKKFGETIGIKPTGSLSKSSLDQKPFSLLAIHIQKRGSAELSIFERAALGFEIDSESMPIAAYYLYSPIYSIYIRQINEFASDGAVITPSFAKQDLQRKVMVILHEDLHGSIHTDGLSATNNLAETLVTPLGLLATLEFFNYKNDEENIGASKFLIDYYQTFSRELNSLEEDIRSLSDKIPAVLLCQELYEKRMLDKYPTYGPSLKAKLRPYDRCVAEEAAITSDLMYWKYFDKVISIYEKSGGLKALIEDMKQASSTQSELENFLDELDKKYRTVTER